MVMIHVKIVFKVIEKKVIHIRLQYKLKLIGYAQLGCTICEAPLNILK